MDKINITLIVGTTRKDNFTIKAARLVQEVIIQDYKDIDLNFVNVADYFPLPGEGNDDESKDPRWIEINKKTDGYIIVSPEYNHSFPGSLKMLLDNDLGNYTYKPVCLAGVSSGPFGGVRMIENILSPLREMGFIVTFKDIYFPYVQKMFDKEKESSTAIEKQKGFIKDGIDELLKYVEKLK